MIFTFYDYGPENIGLNITNDSLLHLATLTIPV